MKKATNLSTQKSESDFSRLFESNAILQWGRDIIRTESSALEHLVEQLDDSFCHAIDLLYQLRGNLIVTGIGKAGLIGQKLVATFASTGTRAHFLHPSEALHGDLGRVAQGDIVLMLSQSGETGEVVRLLPALQKFEVPLIAITASGQSSVGKEANVTLSLGNLDEAGSLKLAPSTSTTMMLALGDALALVVSRLRGFQMEDFANFHPGGSLGLKLSSVEEHMRKLPECRMASDGQSVREVLITSTKPGRRSGAVLLVNESGQLTGLFTDSDLARLIEQRNDRALDRPVRQVMSSLPMVVPVGTKMTEATELLAARKFSELPVVDTQGKPLGLIDITDVVALLPKGGELSDGTEANERSPDEESDHLRIYSHREAA